MHQCLIDTLATLFGLTLLHVAADLIPQTEQEALRKVKSSLVRAFHCLTYTAIMIAGIALLSWFSLPIWSYALAAFWIFASHFAEDTYIPPMLWAKYCRRGVEFSTVIWDAETGRERMPTDGEAMRSFCGKPINLFLVIWVDQFVHVVSLIPVAIYLVTR